MSNYIIKIISGEGEQGTVETYSGKMSITALKARLTKERAGGDRWARAEVWEDGQFTQLAPENIMPASSAAAALGSLGGHAKSPAKAATAKANGAKSGGRPRTPKSYHVSNLGSFGGGIPRDQDGYTYTSIAGWMSARMDWGYPEPSRAEKIDQCREMASAARAAIKKAEAGLAKWQAGN